MSEALKNELGRLGIITDGAGGITVVNATVTGLLTQSGSLDLLTATDAITAFATGGQTSAVALTTDINRVTVCATAHDSVKLPTSAAGLNNIVVINDGAAALDVYPITGDKINALAANVAVTIPPGKRAAFNCAVAGTWSEQASHPVSALFGTGTTTTTFAAGQLTGANFVNYTNTGATPGSIATRTATLMFADDPNARVGGTYKLRICNGGTSTLTVTAGAGVTLTGTATVAPSNCRDFIVTYTSATALVIQEVSGGATFVNDASAQTIGGVKTFSAIPLMLTTNAITAFATGGQGSAVALTSNINRVTVCATIHDSVKLPTATAGTGPIEVINDGATGLDVFPATGDLINGLAANLAVTIPTGKRSTFNCAVTGTWSEDQPDSVRSQFVTNTTTTTFAAGQLSGANDVVYTNTAATPGSIATRTAALMFTDDPQARVGGTYRLRVVNQGTSLLTMTAGGGVTLTGTATVNANSYRDYVVTYTSAAALVMQEVSGGSNFVLSPAAIAAGSTKTLTAANAGATTLLDTNSGSVVTLPAATGTGNTFKFFVSVATTSAAHKILTGAADNVVGLLIGQNSNTAKVFQGTSASAYRSLQMPFAGTQPSGGLQGDWFEFIDTAANTWFVKGAYSAGTTPTTPFSTATS